jgi:hypothetical protein
MGLKFAIAALPFFAILAGVAFAQGVAQRPGTVRSVTASPDTATARDFGGWIAWRSAASGSKTQNIPPCAATINGASITVIDAIGNATAGPISIQTSGGSHIGGSANGYEISSNHSAVQLVCDGSHTDWLVIGQSIMGLAFREEDSTSLVGLSNGTIAGLTPGPGVYCDNRATQRCSYVSYEDTIRPSDNGGTVEYTINDGPLPVRIGLPRSNADTAFAPGNFMVTLVNHGAIPLNVYPTPPSTINGTQMLPVPGGDTATISSTPQGNYSAAQLQGYGHVPLREIQRCDGC